MTTRTGMAMVDRVVWSAEAGEDGAPEGVPDLVQVTGRAFVTGGDTFYVRSSSVRGKFYRVRDGACSCKGFAFSHSRTCQHIQHLVDAGWLVPDPMNGGWQIGHGGNPEREATRVTTGIRHSLGPADGELAARDAQIRRLQAYAKAQREAMVVQHRLITAFRHGNDFAVRRLSGELEKAYEVVRQRGNALRKSDLVELNDGG